MSNFDFLKDFDNTLWKLGNRIEKQVNISPSGVKSDATTFLEHILKKLLKKAGLKYNSRKNFSNQVDAVFRSDLKMSNAYRQRIKNAYNYRNKIHDEFEDIEKHEFEDAVQLHEKLFYIARKYYRDYNDDYDEYKGVPDFKPLELDFSDSEVEIIKFKDFNEIVDVKYDYCVVCGQPNHLNYSIYCHKCSSKLDNANNFISIRNAFGKDAKFTKEDLIEYGMPEGYVNQFINSLVRDNMLKVAGRFITFNNMYLDDYLKMIDNYISVGELITRFKEDKISPKDIKKSKEYKLGSNKQEPFYQFYKITNREIRKKFENDLLTTENIWESIEYTTITEKELERWYHIQLTNYHKGQYNQSFNVFNDLLIKEYLEFKSEGILESEIRKNLNVSDNIYKFWCDYDADFEKNIKQIKIDLLSKAIQEGKTRDEILEFAGVTPKEYDDLVKVSDFKNNEFSKIRNEQIEYRKSEFIKYLKNNDLKSSCKLAKISLNDFYKYYDEDTNSEFHKKSTEILMDKYLAQRRLGRDKKQAIDIVQIPEKYLDRWLSWSMYSDFKDEDLKVTVELILKGLKSNKSLNEISKIAFVSEDRIKSYIKLGERGSAIYKPIYDYFASEILPRKLDKFLKLCETKSIRKSLASSNLTKEEVGRYFELGKAGDERFIEFYNKLVDIKKRSYFNIIVKGKSHKIAMRESLLTENEYLEYKDEIDISLNQFKFDVVLENISNNKTSNIAANKANCSVEDIYDWYFKGKNGDENYVDFYESFHLLYVNPNIVPMAEMIENENADINILIKSNKDKFTKKDVEIWIKHGLVNPTFNLNSNKKDDEDSDDVEINLGKFNKTTNKRSSLGRLMDDDIDIEKIKKQFEK